MIAEKPVRGSIYDAWPRMNTANPHQRRRNLLVELAYTWADIEREVRLMNARLGRALAHAVRVEVSSDEYDLDAALVVADALDIAPDYEPQNVETIGWYTVVFRPDGFAALKAAEFVERHSELGGAIERHARNAFTTVQVVQVELPTFLKGEVCRRPVEVAGSRPRETPTVKRGRHHLTPIEAKFYDELRETGLVFAVQAEVQGTDRLYRPDFVVYHRGGAVAVELDGHEAHKTREQRKRDAEKDRWLQSKGFRVVRWTGSDVHHDATACVAELGALVRQFDRSAM